MHINRFLLHDFFRNHRLFAHSIVPAFAVLYGLVGGMLVPAALAHPSWPEELGLPQSLDRNIRLIENDGFVIGYDQSLGRAAWVAYRLTAVSDYVNRPRPPFIDDPRLQKSTDTHVYDGPDYDRGHLAPNYAMSQLYGQVAQRQSFYYSNIVPQRPRLNQLVWQRLEEIEIDDIAPRHGPLWVLLGPVPAARVALGDDPKGDGGSEPPVAFFRIWIGHDKDGAWQATAFMVPQSVRGDEPLVQFLVAIAAIEARTGMNFFPALSETEQAHLENSPAPPRRFGLETLACMPARYAPRWRDRGAVRLDFDRCAIH